MLSIPSDYVESIGEVAKLMSKPVVLMIGADPERDASPLEPVCGPRKLWPPDDKVDFIAALDNVLEQPHQTCGALETRKAMGMLVRETPVAHFAARPLITPYI